MNSGLLYLKLLIFPVVLSSLIAFTATFLIRTIYLKMKWIDDPKKQKHPKITHTYPVPRGGGIALYLAVTISATYFLGIDKHLIGILLGGLLITLIGFLDDHFNLNPYLRLILGFLAATCVVASGIGIAFITNPFGEGVLHLDYPRISFYLFGEIRSIWIVSDIFALIWIVWNMNMVNWSKGIDGQLPGIVIVAAFVIALLSFRFTEDITQWEVSILAAITAGSYFGFLPWNFYPQKIMPGYGGGSLAGYLLATLAILSGAKVATMILVLGIPTMDAIYIIIRRVAAGKSPVWGDRGHFHHRLLDIGWSKRKIAVFYWILSGLFGLIALQLNAGQKLFTILTLALVMGGVLLWFRFFSISSKVPDPDNG